MGLTLAVGWSTWIDKEGDCAGRLADIAREANRVSRKNRLPMVGHDRKMPLVLAMVIALLDVRVNRVSAHIAPGRLRAFQGGCRSPPRGRNACRLGCQTCRHGSADIRWLAVHPDSSQHRSRCKSSTEGPHAGGTAQE